MKTTLFSLIATTLLLASFPYLTFAGTQEFQTPSIDYPETEEATSDSISWPEIHWPEIVHGDASEAGNPQTESSTLTATTSSAEESLPPPAPRSISKSAVVGEIPYTSGVSQTGARTYNVPIEVYPGIDGMQPAVSLAYDSQRGNSMTGIGWALAGLPVITRGTKSVYYDREPRGIQMDITDAFFLDGVRLIQSGRDPDRWPFRSETGDIIVHGMTPDGDLACFEVFYPDGKKGIFGFPDNSTPQLSYPLTSLIDLHGNRIEYDYIQDNGVYYPVAIRYNGASVEFLYADRDDVLSSYLSGSRTVMYRLLESITCRLSDQELRTYSLSYSDMSGASLLNSIRCSSGIHALNPLCFSYGAETGVKAFSVNDISLGSHFIFDSQTDINSFQIVPGRFDHDRGTEGLIVYPSVFPYLHDTRNGRNWIINPFNSGQKILVYTCLDPGTPEESVAITAGDGFISMLSADLTGRREDNVIKVNNSCSINKEWVTFTVYARNLYGGLSQRYTRTYKSAERVYMDKESNPSVHPKFWYTGDFNGDGKDEVMGISLHQPTGDSQFPSEIFLYDLENDNLLFHGHVMDFKVMLPGTANSDADFIALNSDRIIIIDCDGDGKSDICHIHEKGTTVYTFSGFDTGSPQVRVLSSTIIPDRKYLEKRDLMAGEFDGDGLPDLLVTPTSKYNTADYKETLWHIFHFTGQGNLYHENLLTSVHRTGRSDNGFMVQDIDRDGRCEVISYDGYSFRVYAVSRDGLTQTGSEQRYSNPKSILAPFDINNRRERTCLLALSDGKVSKYDWKFDRQRQSLLTEMTNSLGVVERTSYSNISREGMETGYYQKGNNAVYPYVDIDTPLDVVGTAETWVDEKRMSLDRYSYYNALFHRQGLGFRGFEGIAITDLKNRRTERTYDPYNFCVLTGERTPASEISLSYDFSKARERTGRVLLTGKTEKDFLRNTTTTYSYEYDSYGFPTKETISYSGEATVVNSVSYVHSPEEKDGYYLGFPYDRLTTTRYNGDVFTEREYIPAYSRLKPNVIQRYRNGKSVSSESFTYDSRGSVLRHSTKRFSGKSLTTSYKRDGLGRITEETDPRGHVTRYRYDSYGRPDSITDARGNLTAYGYDAFGRKTWTRLPDGTSELCNVTWDKSGKGLYVEYTGSEGRPDVRTYHDALGRTVRESTALFDGTFSNVDRGYDPDGNLIAESLPFTGAGATYWNTFTYDLYGRPLTASSASGASRSWTYSGRTVTETENGRTSKSTSDVFGNLISRTDPTGTATYSLAADGQVNTITLTGGHVTRYTYDVYRRQSSVTDPSSGTISQTYDAGGNIAVVTDARGKTISHEYDSFGLLTKTVCPEMTTVYTYDDYGQLTSAVSSNSSSRSYLYDSKGRLSKDREEAPDGIWLEREYTYDTGSGLVTSIAYRTSRGMSLTEDRTYAQGVRTEVKVNGTSSVYSLEKVNEYGQPTEIKTGDVTRKYQFSPYGLPARRVASTDKGTIQHHAYGFDQATGQLVERRDITRKLMEAFSYDALDRLTAHGLKRTTYDAKGNITSHSDVGSFTYGSDTSPYAITGAETDDESLFPSRQSIRYGSFSRPVNLTEKSFTASFQYNDAYDRVRMSVMNGIDEVRT
ncbi:MAG: hypothetical protein HDR80_01180, partial [Bacteroides sp.]|nr:hypothetical protein [Bacteroides sp.]